MSSSATEFHCVFVSTSLYSRGHGFLQRLALSWLSSVSLDKFSNNSLELGTTFSYQTFLYSFSKYFNSVFNTADNANYHLKWSFT
jgi:hypothetical protein